MSEVKLKEVKKDQLPKVNIDSVKDEFNTLISEISTDVVKSSLRGPLTEELELLKKQVKSMDHNIVNLIKHQQETQQRISDLNSTVWIGIIVLIILSFINITV